MAFASSKKRLIVITGGAAGIGWEIAKRFSGLDDKVLVLDLHEYQGIEPFSLTNIVFIEKDLLKVDTETVVREIEEKHGSIDVLVNCAGVYPSKPALQITMEEWDTVMNLNTRLPFFLSQSVARHMIKNKVKGVIINIASTAARIARPGVAHYCASKSALVMLTKALAMEWSPYGIRVNAVCPGLVETENLKKSFHQKGGMNEHKEKIARIPLGRAAQPEEVAGAVCFLVGTDAGFITGQELYIDGGYSAGQFFSTYNRGGDDEI